MNCTVSVSVTRPAIGSLTSKSLTVPFPLAPQTAFPVGSGTGFFAHVTQGTITPNLVDEQHHWGVTVAVSN
jgi:hypothetical protein